MSRSMQDLASAQLLLCGSSDEIGPGGARLNDRYVEQFGKLQDNIYA